MAGPSRSIRKRKAELSSYLDSARTVLSMDSREVRREVRRMIDLPARIRNAWLNHTRRWIGAAVASSLVVGFILHTILKRSRKEKVKVIYRHEEEGTAKKSIIFSIMGAVVTTAISIAKPSLVNLAHRKLEKLVQDKLHPGD